MLLTIVRNPRTPPVRAAKTDARDARRIRMDIKQMLKFIKYWLPVIIYAILIFCVSGVPGEEIPFYFSYQDVVAHILEYALLAVLVSRALKAYYPAMKLRRRIFWTVMLVVAYAVSDEFHQGFVPHRDPSLIDVGYDSLGALFAGILYR